MVSCEYAKPLYGNIYFLKTESFPWNLLRAVCYTVGSSETFPVCPKHVELILEINKTIIVASSWCSILLYLQ
jgi:hypothetical protein